MRSISRRDFLLDSAALSAALAGAATLGNSVLAEDDKATKKGEANDRLRVAMIGVHGQGAGDTRGFAGKHNCVVTTICDCDEAVIGTAMKNAEKDQGSLPKYEKDLRKVVEDKNIDVISIATPNHWHALAAIWAIQNGKDVYVQKPVSHNVWEGRQIVEAARKHNRIVQTGTQSRSMAGMRDAIAYLHSGALGKVQVARGLCYKRRESIGKVSGPQEPPKTMDYDLWCGPAPNKPPMRNTPKNGTVHYDWHWFWDYGNGDLGNQGIHEMDKARWGIQKTTLPKSVVSLGGRFGYVDDGQTANTQLCVFDYGDVELIFEVRGLDTKDFKGAKVGNIFHCEGGYLVCPNYFSGVAFDRDGKKIKEWNAKGDHYENFVKAVRSRKPADLHADILDGHLSSALCHLANISYRLGTEQPYDKAAKAFGDDKEAAATFARTQEHLKDNKVPLDKTLYRVGPKLEIDAKAEKFVGNKKADELLTREYRKGFVVPAKV